ncbi:MAG: serine hydrolase [Actinomycetota bacterium]
MTVLASPLVSPWPPLPAQPDGVPFPTSGWPAGTLDPATKAVVDGLMSEVFERDDADTPDGEFGQSLAVVAVQGGRLVAERYGPTAGPDERLISWSMAKSITQALAGVLVAEGRLNLHLPAPVAEWHDEGDPRAEITLDHLLRMVPGTEFNEDYVDAGTSHCIEMLFGSGAADMGGYVAALPSTAPPDTVFNYSSGTTVLICRLLADVVGRGPAFESWMRAVLLDPLGIDATLTFDDHGVWVGSSFLHASARDFAKFGLLYARDGVWDGTRILPEGWVDYARTRRAVDDESGTGYGAQWWLWPHGDGVFYASGYETQRIIVDPANDLVLVRLGKTPTERAAAVDGWLERLRRALATAPAFAGVGGEAG